MAQPRTTAAPPLRVAAERLAAALPPLMVEAQRIASTVSQGMHGRRRAGPGDSFWQFRLYQPGDRPQSVDWRQTAKSQHTYVREQEWAAAQTLYLWRDTSPSMAWRSSDSLPTKGHRASLLLLALAWLLLRGGERVALLSAASRLRLGRAAYEALASELSLPKAQTEDLPPFLPLPGHARLVLVGDFLSPLEKIAQRFKALAGRGLAAHVVQLLDPAEESLPFQGRIRFEGLEGEEPWLLPRTEDVRSDYLSRLAQQRAGLQDLVRSLGWSFASHRSDHSAESALLALYMALAPKGVG